MLTGNTEQLCGRTLKDGTILTPGRVRPKKLSLESVLTSVPNGYPAGAQITFQLYVLAPTFHIDTPAHADNS